MSRSQQSQQGLAVINALVIVIATSLIAVSLLEKQGQQTERLIAEQERSQAVWLLQGGLDWVQLLLRLDARHTPITTRHGLLAQRIQNMPIETVDGTDSALFSGHIEDEQGKFNLLRLVKGEQVQRQQIAQLEELLTWINLPQSLAQSLAEQLAGAYQSSADDMPQQIAGRRPTELIAVAQLNIEQKERLNSYCTLLPPHSKLNVNTAPAEVLAATIHGLSLSEALTLVKERDQGNWFMSASQFLHRLSNADNDTLKKIDIKSHWFLVHGEIQRGVTHVQQQALLHRQPNQTTVLWSQ